MTRTSDEITTEDARASLRRAQATDDQPDDEEPSNPKEDDQDAAPEEAGYGYGV